MEYFGESRERYFNLMANPDEIEKILQLGSSKAQLKAKEVLNRVKDLTGFK
jgi:hypothetical protein